MKSMTGYGRSLTSDKERQIEVEIRSVNSRFFKFTAKSAPEVAPYESEIKKIISAEIKRGTVTVTINYESYEEDRNCKLNKNLLEGYYKQLLSISERLGTPPPAIDALLNLPGVIDETSFEITQEEWSYIEKTIHQALARMSNMRKQEGSELFNEIKGYCAQIEIEIRDIGELVPGIVDNYQERLKNRLMEFLSSEKLAITQDEVLREVAIFSERIDISEELARLESHIKQFLKKIEEDGAKGKTLEFLAQEMHREANTISSKANDAKVSIHVVNLKSIIEKIKEQLQNVE